jgi:N-acetylneuraminate synthase/N,N'-diacetyllegionaminate synthase
MYHRRKKVKLGKKLVGKGEPTFIIVEGGVTNYGSFSLAKKQANAAVRAKGNSVKFQAWKTENLVSKKASTNLAKELGYDWFKRLKEREMTFSNLYKLKRYCDKKGIIFFATPHDEESLDFLDKKLKVPFFKIGSGESNNYDFLERIGSKKKPVIISFGLQSDKEAKKAVNTLFSAGAKGVIALHCTTAYPTPYGIVDLKRIERLKKLLKVPVGISDHTVGWHVPLAAVSLGASVIEKHITFDKSDPRSLDNPGALLPDEFKLMISQIRDIEKAMIPIAEKNKTRLLKKSRDWALQSIVTEKNIPKDTVITRKMLSFKRPGKGGILPKDIRKVLGKKSKILIEKDTQILLRYLR